MKATVIQGAISIPDSRVVKCHLVAPKINSQCLILLINLEAKKVYKRVNYYESCDCTEDKVNPNYCPIKIQTTIDTISNHQVVSGPFFLKIQIN